MKWEKLTIRTTTEAEDLVVEMLAELGIYGAEVVDKQQVLPDSDYELYKEVMPEVQVDDGTAEVIFYLDEDADEEQVISDVKAGLSELSVFVNIGSGEIELGETEDKDWVNNWKKHFHAFYVDDILIKPTWVEKPQDDHSEIMIEIDPGTAFGTGSHETTKLCIHALRKWMNPNASVLDVGTGSGILGIIALKLGAKNALGTDIDELAISAAEENIELNGYNKEIFPCLLGNMLEDRDMQEKIGMECYDIVVSNILADVIIPLSGMIDQHLKPGALFICSGIINTKEEAVRKAISANPKFEIIDTTYEGDWVSFAARKIG